ncbi:MAG: hypothetical protein KTR18_12220, partial [Acidiferrobacterales bacterium]|nr:hypothetical protein [Acidiferrobacterales bacterium]
GDDEDPWREGRSISGCTWRPKINQVLRRGCRRIRKEVFRKIALPVSHLFQAKKLPVAHRPFAYRLFTGHCSTQHMSRQQYYSLSYDAIDAIDAIDATARIKIRVCTRSFL